MRQPSISEPRLLPVMATKGVFAAGPESRPVLGGERSKRSSLYNINVSCYYPYCYVSRKLFPREQRCNIIEKECLTVKWAAGTLWHYSLGPEFTLVTDHYSLLQMNQRKDRSTRITQQHL